MKVELLAPAGSFSKLKTAFYFGADAAYIGGKDFSLRSFADNFTRDELEAAVKYAHASGKKVYVTANIFAKNADMPLLEDYFSYLQYIKADAAIVSDAGVLYAAKKSAPSLHLHISTQANLTNKYAVKFWSEQGASRVILARELSLDEIAEIHSFVPETELETFVHGAMCISYSGRCLLSNYFTGRDANQGACTHPCRWKYAVVEETRPGEYLPVYENERGTYIFNSKDLCMIEYIPEIVGAGIDSLKIEGRMKTALYVACVARTYRKAIDDFFVSEETYRKNMEWYSAEIAKCTYRQFTTGFYFGKPDENTQIYDSNTYVNEYVYLGSVESVDERGLAKFEQKNKFCVGDTIELMKPDGRNIHTRVLAMYNEDKEAVENCPHSRQVLYVALADRPETYDLMRVEAAK